MRRAVITGLGVVAPGGIGVKAYWDLLTAGRTATRDITLFDATGFRSRIAAECDFDPLAAGLTAGQAGTLDRAAQFAVVSAREALADAGLAPGALPPERTAVSIGSAVGCTMSLERHYVRASDHGRHWTVAHTTDADLHSYLVPSSIAREVAWDAGAEGPVSLLSNGCTSGLDAVRHGARLIEDGLADVVLAGASDAPISPITSACFDAIKATSPNNAEAATASRPFDGRRDGFVLGEGAAVLVLESPERAAARDAPAYGVVAGGASRANAYHMTGLRADGREMAEAIRVALGQARRDPSDVHYVNAHGSGTRQNDRHETAAFKASLGAHAYRVPVSSIKSMIGHSLGAVGALELAACALVLRHHVVPPTANLHRADPECDLDYVPVHARDRRVDTIVSVGSGFGGFQTAIVLTAPDGGVRR
ncbi:beta-ketoacyl-[acyl-carrier-protein] synthase family protein [Dactylosporangium sp. AC04546]|uniref:beta-ketoacyl-[acyl-carrier-protein] synthase family protein n=1 Tax=Dactylosporangium sp. AC04546 TaxID=2862460 RepID=UPI001EE025B2|nr:beta-ketoacyl-[acyl-carrier-protein] synthase family protein [Dactylosporangium sp. AC04546]WVK79069.1 beta-ketoacyl-[acyl-carrier-protein] synthase family protein [Dactylosporangium sp. AC04546]